VAGDPAAFPADQGYGVVVHVGGAGDGGVGCETQEGAGAKLDGSGEVVAGGKEDFATAEERAAVDGLLDGLGVFGGAVAFGSVVSDVQGEVGGFWGSLGLGFGFRWRCGEGWIVDSRDDRCSEEGLAGSFEEFATRDRVARHALTFGLRKDEVLSRQG